jgi:hypothetical protein
MKSKENSRLSPRQLQAMPHILATPTYEEAARQAKVSSKQIYKWLQGTEFKAELSRRRSEAYNEALFALKTLSSRAVETLATLLIDDNPRIRLGAADKILAHTLKSVEYLGFEERLKEVENRIELALKLEVLLDPRSSQDDLSKKQLKETL